MRIVPDVRPPCPGPLVWYPCDRGAVLHCARPECGHITVTGNLNEPRHACAPLLLEGLAL